MQSKTATIYSSTIFIKIKATNCHFIMTSTNNDNPKQQCSIKDNRQIGKAKALNYSSRKNHQTLPQFKFEKEKKKGSLKYSMEQNDKS